MAGGDQAEFFELRLFERAAFGLDFAELLYGLDEAAMDALLVERKRGDRIGVRTKRFSHRESSVRLGMTGLPAITVLFKTMANMLCSAAEQRCNRNWRSAQAFASSVSSTPTGLRSAT